MKYSVVKVVLSFVFSVLLSGCLSTLQTVNSARGIYNNTKAGVTAYHSYDTVKAIAQAEPLFKEYDSVKVDVKLAPRESGLEKDLASAFDDNVEYVVQENSRISDLSVSLCNDICSGKTIVVQFKEAAYNSNIVQAITVGGKLRGKLYYTDYESGNVIKEEKLEVAENYEGLLKRIHASVGSKMIKSMDDPEGERAEEVAEKFNKFNPVKPEYRELFQQT